MFLISPAPAYRLRLVKEAMPRAVEGPKKTLAEAHCRAAELALTRSDDEAAVTHIKAAAVALFFATPVRRAGVPAPVAERQMSSGPA